LTFSEAMATGLPTIGVGWSGNTEFMNDRNALLVKTYALKEVTPGQADFQSHYIGHKWADCDLDELAGHMRRLFEDRELGRQLGRRARADMVERFSWGRAVEVMKRRLDEIFSGI
jgi:glycosyltransferase involved in cell wall biosynthesis